MMFYAIYSINFVIQSIYNVFYTKEKTIIYDTAKNRKIYFKFLFNR